jgi:hypothetical protein
MPTRSSSRAASAIAAATVAPRWTTRLSAIWSPIVKTGFSEVIGSWKIMPTRLPRIRRNPASSSASMSSPSNRMRPPSTRAGGSGSRRIAESAVTLLPQPDSPTSPSVSPGAIAKDTSSSTGAPPMATVSPSTASSGASAMAPRPAHAPARRLDIKGPRMHRLVDAPFASRARLPYPSARRPAAARH